jgi:hypothetical protein
MQPEALHPVAGNSLSASALLGRSVLPSGSAHFSFASITHSEGLIATEISGGGFADGKQFLATGQRDERG